MRLSDELAVTLRLSDEAFRSVSSNMDSAEIKITSNNGKLYQFKHKPLLLESNSEQFEINRQDTTGSFRSPIKDYSSVSGGLRETKASI